MQEVLAVLEEGVEAADMLDMLQVVMKEAVMVVMVQQEAMVEAEGVVVIVMTAALVALAVLVALD